MGGPFGILVKADVLYPMTLDGEIVLNRDVAVPAIPAFAPAVISDHESRRSLKR